MIFFLHCLVSIESRFFRSSLVVTWVVDIIWATNEWMKLYIERNTLSKYREVKAIGIFGWDTRQPSPTTTITTYTDNHRRQLPLLPPTSLLAPTLKLAKHWRLPSDQAHPTQQPGPATVIGSTQVVNSLMALLPLFAWLKALRRSINVRLELVQIVNKLLAYYRLTQSLFQSLSSWLHLLTFNLELC